MPLVGPLENGQLITSVQINTHGPYLFAIDPDAPMSMIDAELVKKLDLRSFPGPKRLDESDTQQVRFYAELLGLEIGTLIIERGNTIIVREHTLDGAGRRIMGVLGRDMLADSLAWGFDRDQGLVYVQTQKSFKPPPDATPVVYGELVSRVPNVQTLPPPRRLVDVTINGEKFAMHVDLGATASQLRDGLWEKAKLVPRDVKTVVIDEVGFGRSVSKASEPAPVQLAGSVTGNAVFIPYGDKRWESQDIAGTIGLGFFDNYSVWQSWHTKQYFIVPRKDVPAKTRIARWDSPVFAKCQNVGCVTIRVTDPLAGKALEPGKQHPGLVVSITRDEVAGGMALEVILEATPNSAPPPAAPATDAPAAPAPAAPDPAAPPTTPTAPAPTAPAAPAGPLPRLLVNMPGHVDKMLHQLPATFLNTTLTVVDASPFPRACPTPNGCVDLLAR